MPVMPVQNSNQNFSASRFEENLVYLDDYLDTLESLPAEMQRSLTLMQQLDASAQEELDKVGEFSMQFLDTVGDLTPEQRVEQLKKLGDLLSSTSKYAEEKVSLATSTYDTVDRHIRRLDDDLQKFEDEQMTGPGRINATTTNVTNITNTNNSNNIAITGSNNSNRGGGGEELQHQLPNRKQIIKSERGDKKDSKNEKRNNGEPPTKKHTQSVDMPIDPNEPIYCYCKQVSYGEMVACDNSECEIEWFHFSCVGLTDRPKGKWYCQECSEKSRNSYD
ncbi:3256_t:CDS:2 [Diversispora eburnea]|uniref:Chromatin modification-related protein n=1 Tax=Diversispora eburnea TaxID=1213867 RepID=A0A9N8YMN1_9GLOM|nr:3256_t:CDS:2 [Diversispora eburnea]